MVSKSDDETEIRALKAEIKALRGELWGVSVGSTDSCDACGKKETEALKLKRCGGCRVGRYCSNECQIADWKHGKHKERCFQA